MTSDEKSLHEMVYQLEAAWNAADAQSFAEAFAEDADFIHILGGYYKGRAAIEAGQRMILGTIYKGSAVRFSVERIRFLRPDVAIVSLRQYLQFYDAGAPTELEARPTLIADKRDGKWQIVHLQNTRITEVGPSSRDKSGAAQESSKS
jgi:uncharacterized protein (TIGR02246 family)